MTTWDFSEAPIRASARKHGVADADIRHALRHWIRVLEKDDDDVLLFLGPDRAARLVEVGVRSDGDGVRIVHAMRPAREHRFESGR